MILEFFLICLDVRFNFYLTFIVRYTLDVITSTLPREKPVTARFVLLGSGGVAILIGLCAIYALASRTLCVPCAASRAVGEGRKRVGKADPTGPDRTAVPTVWYPKRTKDFLLPFCLFQAVGLCSGDEIKYVTKNVIEI